MKRSTGVVLIVVALLAGAWHGHGRHERWLAKQRKAQKERASESAAQVSNPVSTPDPLPLPDPPPDPAPPAPRPTTPRPRPAIDLGARTSSVDLAETLYRGGRFEEAVVLLAQALDGVDPSGANGERLLHDRARPLLERCELFARLTRRLAPSPMADGEGLAELVLQGGAVQLARIVGEDEAGYRFLDIAGKEQSVARGMVLGRRPVSAEAWRSYAEDRIRRQEQAMVGSGEADPLTLAHLGGYAQHLGRTDWTLAYFEQALEKPQGPELLKLLAAVMDRGPSAAVAAPPEPAPVPRPRLAADPAPLPLPLPLPLPEASEPHDPEPVSEDPRPVGDSPAFQEASAIFESALDHYRKAMPWEADHDEHLRLARERFEDARDRFLVVIEGEPGRTAEVNEILRRCQSLLFDCIKRSRR